MDPGYVLREKAARCVQNAQRSRVDMRDQWLYMASCWLIAADQSDAMADLEGRRLAPLIRGLYQNDAPASGSLNEKAHMSDAEVEALAERMVNKTRNISAARVARP